MLGCRLARLGRPPRMLDRPQCISRLTPSKRTTGCQARLTGVPAGEDDGLDEGNGQQDGRGACEAPVQRRLEKVLIRSPPDWSHLRCQAALSGRGGTKCLVVVDTEGVVEAKDEEARL